MGCLGAGVTVEDSEEAETGDDTRKERGMLSASKLMEYNYPRDWGVPSVSFMRRRWNGKKKASD
jgi:hypothetical protein